MKIRPAYLIALILFVAIPSLAFGQDLKTFASLTKISPDWIRMNPGKLTVSTGTAMNGSNGYTVKLNLPQRAVCRIGMRLLPKKNAKSEPDLAMYSTEYLTDSPSSVVTLRFRENQPYAFAPIFHVEILGEGTAPHRVTTRTYEIDFREIDSLQRAFLKQRRKLGESP